MDEEFRKQRGSTKAKIIECCRPQSIMRRPFGFSRVTTGNDKLQIFELFEPLDKFHRILIKDILIHDEGGDWGSYLYFSPRASIRSLASLSAQDCILVSGL